MIRMFLNTGLSILIESKVLLDVLQVAVTLIYNTNKWF